MAKPYHSTSPQRAAHLARQGAAICAARRAAGLSRAALAEALGVSAATVQSWEQGRRCAAPELRYRIVAEWGGDPKILGPEADACPCCGRSWDW